VDFYIRLGFNDEALAKLSEIARINPDNPELALRYEKLGQTKAATIEIEPILLEDSDDALGMFGEADTPGDAAAFQPSDTSDVLNENENLNSMLEIFEEETVPPQDIDLQIDMASSDMFDVTKSNDNGMFADLMNGASPSNQEATDSFFEEHFSMGTVYREMELIEEAIKEFELAFKSIEMQKGNPLAVQCCGMLSTCFLNKNMPHSVLHWCQTGLDLTEASSHEAIALRYDMGLAHTMAGSNEQALECFSEIYRMDPGCRDVAKKIDELKGGLQQHVP